MDTAATVGLIGVGTMGRGMLQRLLGARWPVLAFDVAETGRAVAGEQGAVVADDLGEVARGAEVLVLSLPGPAQVEAGVAALAEAARPGLVVVDTSTSSPEASRAAVARLASVGASFVDAPVLGRPSAVGAGCCPVVGTQPRSGARSSSC